MLTSEYPYSEVKISDAADNNTPEQEQEQNTI